MKKIKLLTYLLVGFVLFSQTTLSNSMIELIKQGIFKFESETIDYGTIDQNSDGNRTFVFTNTGDAPIVITKVKVTCGCTVATKPEAPILPGDKGEIKVRYATNRIGVFEKNVKVYSDAFEGVKTISIKGKVVKPTVAVNTTKQSMVRTKN